MWSVMDWSDINLTQEVVIAGPFNREVAINVLCVIGSWIEQY